MPIELIPPKEPEYRITNRPGFEDIVFTESGDWLTLPQAVAYAKEQDSILQSAREAAAVRIEAKGEHSSYRCQTTRTASAYVKLDGKWYVAFDDTPEAARNIILARTQEGYDAHRQHKKWPLPKNDEYVKGILSRAEKDDRIIEIAESSLELATKNVSGTSKSGNHPFIQALLGDVANDYTAYLNKEGLSEGFVWVLTPKTLEDLGIGDRAEIRAAGLDTVTYRGLYFGGGYFYVGGVLADRRFDYAGDYQRFYDGGLARGVRGAREFSRK